MAAFDSRQIEAAAEILCESRIYRHRFDRFPLDLEPADEARAYAVQGSLHTRLAGRGWGRLVGHKIGCTTPVMQEYLGIRNPCAGGVFDTTIRRLSGQFTIPSELRVGVECEIAVTLGRDLLPSERPVDERTVVEAVESCAAAIEVVEDRYVDYPSLNAASLIADDFFGAGCVLGEPQAGFQPQDLGTVKATMWINGEAVGSGLGTDVLGDPMKALAWLANNLIGRGQTLRKGDFVLLGSLVQTTWVKPGDEVLIRNQPLGEARAIFV